MSLPCLTSALLVLFAALLPRDCSAALSKDAFREADLVNVHHVSRGSTAGLAVKESDCPDPLSCWLEEISFQIPDTCFDVLSVECCITDFVCHGIDLSNIDSLYSYPTSLYMSFDELGTSCAGDWKYGVLHGTLTADMTDITVSTTAEFPKEDIYAVAMTFPTCEIPSIEIELSFSGGLVGAVLDLISGAVENGLEKAVYSIVCEKFEGAMTEKVTEALITTINPAVEDIVASTPSLRVPWETLPEDVYLDYTASLPGLLRLVEEELGDDYLNRLVDFLTGNTGEVAIDLHELTVSKEVVDPTSGSLANVTMIFHSIELQGLDTFRDIALLTSSPTTSPVYSPYSIFSSISMSALNALLDMTLKVDLNQQAVTGSSLTERFAIELDISDMTLGGELFVPLHLERLSSLYLDQVNDLNCLISTLDFLSISSLVAELHVDVLSITPIGQNVDPESLESDIDNLINDILKVGFSGFPELVTGVIQGLTQGKVREVLNNYLSETLTQSPALCVAHEDIPPDANPSYVVWNDLGALGLVDKVLNDIVGYEGVNKIIDNLTDNTGSISIDLENLFVELFNLDSFYKFAILTPSDSNIYTLDNFLALGYCKGHDPLHKVPCFPVGLSFNPVNAPSAFLPKVFTEKMMAELNVSPDSSVELLFSNETALLSVMSQLDLNKLKGLQLNQLPLFLGDISSRNGCLLSTFDKVEVEALALSVTEATLKKGALVERDILPATQKFLDILGSDKVLGGLNILLQAVVEASAEACETGEWPSPPIPDDDDDDDAAPACDSPVSCFLNHLVLGPIPAAGEEACIDIKGAKACVSDLQCYNMDVEGIPTSLVDAHTISIGLTDFDITCKGSYSFFVRDSEVYSGSAKLKLESFSGSLDVELEPGTSPNYPIYPVGVDMSACIVQPGYTTTVSFEGGVLGVILNKALAPAIENFLAEGLEWLLCYELAPITSRILSKLLSDKIDPVLLEIIDLGTQIIPPVQESGMIAWNASFLQTIHDMFDALKDHHNSDQDGLGDLLNCMREGEGAAVRVSTSSILHFFESNSAFPQKSSQSVEQRPRETKQELLPGITIDIDSVIPLPTFGNTSGSLTLETLTVSDIRTIHDVVLFEPSETSSVTLTSALSLSSLELQLAMLVDLDDTADTTYVDGFGVYQQEIILDLKLEDTTLNMDLVVAMEKSVLGDLYVDQAVDIGCIMSSLEDFRISSLVLDVELENLSLRQVRGGSAGVLEKDTADLLNNAVAVLVDGYPDFLSALVKGIFQGPLKDGVNAGLAVAVQDWKTNHECTAHVDHHANTTSPELVVWGENSVIIALDKVLNDVLGPSGINKFLSCATNGTGAALIHIPPTSSILADWTIGLEGLTSFYEFALLYPVENEPYDLGNMMGLGYCANPNDAIDYNPIDDPFNHGTSCSPFALTVSGYEPDGRYVAIAITLENLHLYLDLLLELNLKALADLKLSQLSVDGCLLSTFSDMGIFDLLISTSDVEFYFLEGDAQVNMTDLTKSILNKLSSPETLQSINDQISEALYVASLKCAGDYHPDDAGGGSSSSNDTGLSNWKWELGLVLSCCVVSVCVLLAIYNHYGTMSIQKERELGKESFDYDGEIESNTTSMYGGGVCFSNECITEKLALLCGWTEGDFHYDALFGQEKIPAYVRILMPLAILGNIALFLNANLAVGASVMAEVDFGDAVIKPDPIFEFGLANTVSDMWKAEVYPLSILVAFFSGAWPYIKLAVMFLCWMLPTSALPLRYRDFSLVWLDILGKWSLLDTYVMVMMMVAFNFNLIAAPGIEIIVYVVPEWGFYAFLLATMTSLGLGHLVLACHRLVTEPKVPSDEYSAEAVMNHTFSVHICEKNAVLSSFDTNETLSSSGHREDGSAWQERKVVFTSCGKFVVILTLALSILAVVVGSFKDSFQFEFRGLTGYLMDPDDRIVPYGLVSIGEVLPSASGSPKDFGIRWIQASYFAFGLGMPLAFLTALLVLWVTPLTLRVQKFCVVMTEVLNAWNALDVFVISIVAALLEIQQFASFIVGDSCDLINEILKETMDSELNGDDKCFDVVATLKQSAMYLYLSSFLLVVVGLIVLRTFHRAVSERVDAFQRQQLADEFSCLSDGQRSCAEKGSMSIRDSRTGERYSEQSYGTSLSGRSTLPTQAFTTQSLLPHNNNPFLNDRGLQDEGEHYRDRVDTVDLNNDEKGVLSGTTEDGGYRPPTFGGDDYDTDVEHVASVLASKSKSSSEGRKTTLVQALSSDDSEVSVSKGRGCYAKTISFTTKAFALLGIVKILNDDDEEELLHGFDN